MGVLPGPDRRAVLVRALTMSVRAPAEPECAKGQYGAASRDREEEKHLGCRHGRRSLSAFRTVKCMAPMMIQQTAMKKITGAKCGWSERTVETNGAKPPTAKIATPIPFA